MLSNHFIVSTNTPLESASISIFWDGLRIATCLLSCLNGYWDANTRESAITKKTTQLVSYRIGSEAVKGFNLSLGVWGRRCVRSTLHFGSQLSAHVRSRSLGDSVACGECSKSVVRSLFGHPFCNQPFGSVVTLSFIDMCPSAFRKAQ